MFNKSQDKNEGVRVKSVAQPVLKDHLRGKDQQTLSGIKVQPVAIDYLRGRDQQALSPAQLFKNAVVSKLAIAEYVDALTIAKDLFKDISVVRQLEGYQQIQQLNRHVEMCIQVYKFSRNIRQVKTFAGKPTPDIFSLYPYIY